MLPRKLGILVVSYLVHHKQRIKDESESIKEAGPALLLRVREILMQAYRIG